MLKVMIFKSEPDARPSSVTSLGSFEASSPVSGRASPPVSLDGASISTEPSGTTPPDPLAPEVVPPVPAKLASLVVAVPPAPPALAMGDPGPIPTVAPHDGADEAKADTTPANPARERDRNESNG